MSSCSSMYAYISSSDLKFCFLGSSLIGLVYLLGHLQITINAATRTAPNPPILRTKLSQSAMTGL